MKALFFKQTIVNLNFKMLKKQEKFNNVSLKRGEGGGFNPLLKINVTVLFPGFILKTADMVLTHEAETRTK